MTFTPPRRPGVTVDGSDVQRTVPTLNPPMKQDDPQVMTRRDAVRVKLFARAMLIGRDRSVRCAVVNLSAAGAMLSLTARLPALPLRLAIEFAGEHLEFPVEIVRTPPSGGVAVAFPQPHAELLHRLIAIEQRHALAQGRVNISERRLPPSFRPRPDESSSCSPALPTNHDEEA